MYNNINSMKTKQLLLLFFLFFLKIISIHIYFITIFMLLYGGHIPIHYKYSYKIMCIIVNYRVNIVYTDGI